MWPCTHSRSIYGFVCCDRPLDQVIYHGLLSIGVMLANPLGTEFIDFPGSFYQHIMKAEIDGFRTCADAIQISKRGKGTRWWPGIGL